jgi:hypothetical protein
MAESATALKVVEETTSFDDLLGTAKTTKTPKKKSKASALINAVPAKVQEAIDKLLAAKKAKKLAESEIKKNEPIIIEHGTNLKDEKAFDGDFKKSHKLGNDESNVNMVTANKWSFSEGDVSEIKELLGEDADEMIIQERDVKLKSEVFKNPELQHRFIKMVGKEFPEFFETVISHHVSEDFDEKIYKKLSKEELEDLRLLMKQSKPSLR